MKCKKISTASFYIPCKLNPGMQSSLLGQLWGISGASWTSRIDVVTGHTFFESYEKISIRDYKACKCFLEGFWFCLASGWEDRD